MNYKILLAFLFFAPALCQDYYADVIINVQDSKVSIEGLTNHPGLISNNNSSFLTFSNNYYLLNISIPGNFSNYAYEIVLPKEAIINYLKTPKIMSMNYWDEKLIIKGLGSDEEFKAIVQYKLSSSNQSSLIFLIIALTSLPIIIAYVLFNKKYKNSKINYFSLTQRQSEIMKIIEKKKMVEQRFLENTLKVPKAAISRNVNSLLKKGLITKQRKGVVNLLTIAK